MQSREKRRWKSWPDGLSIVIFCILLVAPMIGQFADLSGAEEISRIELRSPSKWPSLPANVAQIKEWPGRMSAYLDDYFGFRQWLAALDSQVRVLMGSSGSGKVLVGKGGWLFSRDDRLLQEHRGAVPFEKSEIDTWLRALRRRQRWLEKHSIQHIFVICPTKYEVYADYLPEWAQAVGSTRFDAIKEGVRTETNVDLVDLKPILRKARKETTKLLYSKNDTHWTDDGSTIGYRVIMEAVASYYPNIHIAERGRDYRFVPGRAPGGLRRMMNNWWGFEEGLYDTISVFPRPAFFRAARVLDDGKWEACRPRDVGWDLNRPAVVETSLIDAPRVLIFRDSFTIGIHSLLKLSFSALMFAKHKGNVLDTNLIREFKPNLVIYEMIDDVLMFPPRFDPAHIEARKRQKRARREARSGDNR